MAGLVESDPFGLNALLGEFWEESEQQLQKVLEERKKLNNEIAGLRRDVRGTKAELRDVEKGVRKVVSLWDMRV